MPVVRAESGSATGCRDLVVERQLVFAVAADGIVEPNELDPFEDSGGDARLERVGSGEWSRPETFGYVELGSISPCSTDWRDGVRPALWKQGVGLATVYTFRSAWRHQLGGPAAVKTSVA